MGLRFKVTKKGRESKFEEMENALLDLFTINKQ